MNIKSAFTYIRKHIAIILILLIAFTLRVYDLSSLMQFIPDQGWFYLSARDMLLTGHVPLVGPQTSHPWIHHGPLWTYTLALIFYFFSFNPIAPAYAIAILGTFTVWLMYEVGSKMYSKKVGLISALLFATSPLIVMNSRIPYHTSPIPFLVLVLFYLTFLWVKGNYKIFPLIVFLLAVLYNHEITTFVFDIAIAALFAYGIFKKKKWAKKTLSSRIVAISIVSFLIPMIPFILYDVNNGYKQTFGFLIWVGYRVIKFPLSLFSSSFVSSGSNPSTIPEFLSYYQELVFVSSRSVAIVFLAASLVVGFFSLKKKSLPVILLALFLLVSGAGLFVHRIPIEADTLLMSPFFILLIALLIEQLFLQPRLKLIGIITLALVASINTSTILSTAFFTKTGAYFRIPYYVRMNAVRKTIQLADGKAYNIVGKGELSDFPVFLDPYRYLLWYEGYPPTQKNAKTSIQIWEKKDTISVIKLK